MAKAFNGNTTSLIRLFPELKKSKDLFGDLRKEVEGAAIQQADPFMKFNNSVDILKEKLGNAILPLISEFVDYISKPGGVVDQVGKFLDDLSNPKSEAGKMFKDIKNAVKDAFGSVKDFFALFGNGDAMKGFANVAATLVKALPALIALKGILMLASAGKSIANLAQAVGLIQAKSAANALPGVAGAGIASVAIMSIAAIALTQFAAAVATGMADASVKAKLKEKGLQATTTTSVFSGSGGQTMSIPTTGDVHDLFGFKAAAAAGSRSNTIFNITLTNADPKATVDAISKYVKQYGALPSILTTGKAGR
jgi:hypothetical protein